MRKSCTCLLALFSFHLIQDDHDFRRLFPLIVGNEWTFDSGASMRVTKLVDSSEQGLFEVEFMAKGYQETMHWRVDDSGIVEFFSRTVNNGKAVKIPSPKGAMKMAFPPEKGSSWEESYTHPESKDKVRRAYEILSAESIEVPAGKYLAYPLQISVSCGDKPVEVTTIWFAMNVGVVMRRRVEFEPKREELHKLAKCQVKVPEEFEMPSRGSEELEREIKLQLKELFLQMLRAEDGEGANIIGQAHLNILPLDKEIKAKEEDARAKFLGRGKMLGEVELKAFAEWTKKISEEILRFSRGQKDSKERRRWEVQGMLLRGLPEFVKGLRVLNGYRRDAGLAPVSWDYTLSIGSMLHARYLVKVYRSGFGLNDYHNEQDTSPHFTPEGKRAAQAGVIDEKGIEESIHDWISSFYHRLDPLNPRLKKVGMGEWPGIKPFSVMDAESGRQGSETSSVVVYPASGQTNVRPNFGSEEDPRPVPGIDCKSLGQPITAMFSERSTIADVKATLHDKQSEIECHVHTPQKPSNPDEKRDNVICLIPKKPLSPKTKYSVRIRCLLDGKQWTKEWDFITAEKK